MSEFNQPLNDAFDRFQRLLLEMRAGDELALRDAARLTGLAEPTCRTVLEGLSKKGLMSPSGDDRFVRVTMVSGT
jgi:DNA-binding IclR family transcriptional regulator